MFMEIMSLKNINMEKGYKYSVKRISYVLQILLKIIKRYHTDYKLLVLIVTTIILVFIFWKIC